MKPRHLPETLRPTFRKEETSKTWQSYLQYVVYMHGELEGRG